MLNVTNVYASPRPMDVTISDVESNYGDYRDDAPYQRDYAWDNIRKEKLIVSIFNNIPIGTFHFVISEDKKFYWILDGKQRRHAIYSFLSNNANIYDKTIDRPIKVPVLITQDNVNIPVIITENQEKNIKYMSYYQMLTSKDERVRLLAKSFKNFKINGVSWNEPMDILSQRDLFNQINYSSSLNINERIYCPNFMTKKFLQFVFDFYFVNDIKGLFSYQSIPDNKRFTGIRFLHDICYMCFGDNMMKSFDIRRGEKSEIDKSAKQIHDFFLKENIGENQDFDDNMIIELQLKNQISLLQKSSGLFSKIVNCNNTLSKKFDSKLIFDILCFLIKKIQSKQLTVPQIEKNLEVFNKFVVKYVSWKNDEQDSKGIKANSTTEGKIKARFNKMESILNDLNIDQDKKYKQLSRNDKLIAILGNNGKCESCNTSLSEEEKNYHYDHVKAKSTNSKTPVGILCRKCNETKSNLSDEEISLKEKKFKELGEYYSNKINESIK